MDRLQELLRKLNEEFAENAHPEELLLTLKQMEAYLLVRQAQGGINSQPSHNQTFIQNALLVKECPLPAFHTINDALPLSAPVAVAANSIASKVAYKPPMPSPPAPPAEKVPELHQTLPLSPNNSLNDQLKTENVELGDVLNEAPIRDLKKAIGINDRFVFIAELFRGDEVLYEQSIRTINAFRIYQEANFWMERELRLKLGWDTKNPLVQQFDHLVRRRFS